MSDHDALYAASADVLDVFHGESASLTPAGGQAKTVTVRVNRSGLLPAMGDASGDDGAHAYALIVTVRRSDLPTLTEGGDRIALPPTRGATARTYTLETLINDSGDEWVVGCN